MINGMEIVHIYMKELNKTQHLYKLQQRERPRNSARARDMLGH